MASDGGQDGAGDKRTPTDRNKGKQPIKRFIRGTIPPYLQNLCMLSSSSLARATSPSLVQEASPSLVQESSPSLVQESSPSHVQESSPSSMPSSMNQTRPLATQEPATPPTSLRGPLALPTDPSQSHPSIGGSNIASGSTQSSTTTPRNYGPRRNIRSNVPKDANDKFVIVLSVDNMIIDNHVASVITSIFQEYPQPVAYNAGMIPTAILDKYFEEFRKRCVWDFSKHFDDTMKKAFINKLKERYKGIMSTIRTRGKRPIWCPEEVWEPWTRMWESTDFKRKREIAKKIRVGEDGVAKRNHNGGSSAHAKSVQKLEKDLGRSITPDQFFIWAHTHDHDGVTFVNDRCREIQEEYESNIEQQQTEHIPSELEAAGEAIDEIQAFYVACGGVNRDGAIYGLGSAASHYYRDRMSHPRNARAASSSCPNVNGASSSHGNTQASLHSIQERLDGFNTERTDFIVHLERINERQQRADERQQRMDQTLQNLHLRVDVDEVNQLRYWILCLGIFLFGSFLKGGAYRIQDLPP
ncbi:uncharacterized protein [Euphorbia lathyris]|uniref:uncharacterized protein isoform X2 n=1 Tax=Euphorbia lathyris TaxID=212925 RepID=UPI0033134F3A